MAEEQALAQLAQVIQATQVVDKAARQQGMNELPSGPSTLLLLITFGLSSRGLHCDG